MVRTTRLLLAWTALGVAVSRGAAQAPEVLPPPSQATGPAILRELPDIPDVPNSLFQPEPAPVPPPPPADRPYFQVDPALDRPEWPQPGWFGDVQLGYVTPHVKDGLFNTVTTPSGRTDLVTLPTAPLGWTVSPTFLAGYRLPSGFGGLSLSYRFLDASGTNSTGGPDGLEALRTRLDVNQVDFAYTSREFTPLAHWDLKWTLGLRLASVFWDSQATEPFAAAAAGSGVFLSRVSNHFIGVGPRFGVDVTRHFEASGLSLVGRLHLADLIGRIRQDYTEGFTATGANGSPLFASSPNSGSQSVPVLNAQFGLGWCPPSWKAAHLFVGYQYEHWWDVGQLGVLGSRGELIDQGIVFQAGLNY